MTQVETVEAPVPWTPDHPQVRQLWRTCNQAYVTIADAIEQAGRAGIPVEVIATAASVPRHQVEATLKDAEDADEDGRPGRA